jgi:endoglucanase
MDKAGIGRMLQRLVGTDGPSGVESEVADLVGTLAGEFVTDLRVDALGNVIMRCAGSPTPPGRVMIAAHMDEIGLIVTKVERGFLHVGKVGGVEARTLLGQEVTVYPTGPGAGAYRDGLLGYIGSRPPHLLAAADRDRVVPLHDLRIDLGRPERFFDQGIVRVGDRVAVRGPHTELLGGRVAAKSLDNRASVAAMLGALGYLSSMRHSWEVLAVATTQEEIGLRGAVTSAFGLAPDLALAIDVTFGDTPGQSSDQTVEMDKGPAIGWGPNLHPGIVKHLRDAAEALEIPTLTEPLPGNSGTDAWALQVTREGIPTGLLSIPIRYMHSAVEMVVLSDIDRTARLVAACIARLDANTLARLADELG